MAPIYQLEEVSVSYQSLVALKEISLTIEAGEKIALIGPSGAGKSTLLKHLHQKTPQDASIIHQNYALVPQLSVLHNVYMGRLDRYGVLFNLRNLILPERRIRAEIHQILEQLEMAEKINTPVASLSGGQQQRVAIARSFFRNSEILLGDEPVSSIDPQMADKTLQMIMERSRTVVLTLHSVEFALKYAKRIIGIRQGRIHFDRLASEVNPTLLEGLFRAC